MSRKRWNGALTGALIGSAALVVYGCSGDSSSNNGPPADSGADVVHATHRDASSAQFDSGGVVADSGGAEAGAATYDGTSGKPCSSDADCVTTAGINVCSNFYSGKLNPVNGVMSPQFWPTPLCMVPLPTTAGVGNCDPGDPNVNPVQFCDGDDPNDPASAGLCLPLTIPQQAGAGNGFCLPHCSFPLDGSAPTMPCPGKDTCAPAAYLLDPATGKASGHGYCWGTCQADADCSALGAGWVCQTDDGFCTKAKKTRTKTIGTPCTTSGTGATPVASSDSQTGACYCPGTTTTAFYCTSACVVGGTPCPPGYVCDAEIAGGPLDFTNPDDGGMTTLPAVTMQNLGLPGVCLATCAADGGAGSAPAGDAGAGDAGDGGASSGPCPGTANVPPLSVCTSPSDMGGTVAGPDCLPAQ